MEDANNIKVLSQVFQPFYGDRIEAEYLLGQSRRESLDISMTLFWFSVLDFYSGLYFIGKKRKVEYYRKGEPDSTIKLASRKAAKLFIKEFFPEPEKNFTDFIYSVFRNGMVHQISPKKSGIYYAKYDPRLIYVTDPNGDIVAHMNIYRLQELVYNSYREFKRRIENNEWEQGCKNLIELVLSKQDGFLDKSILLHEYHKLGKKKGLLEP